MVVIDCRVWGGYGRLPQGNHRATTATIQHNNKHLTTLQPTNTGIYRHCVNLIYIKCKYNLQLVPVLINVNYGFDKQTETRGVNKHD